MNLVTHTSPTSAVAEAYRTLRTNIQFAISRQGMKTLVVAAPDSGGSATEAAANLALVYAQSGRRVVLVDGDLRRSQVHTLFDLQNRSGLIEALTTDAPAALLDGPVDGLRILTAGQASVIPADVLSSPNIADLLRDLSAQADVVLITAPPATQYADASLLAAAADAVVLVVTRDRTRIASLTESRRALERAGATLLGVFLA